MLNLSYASTNGIQFFWHLTINYYRFVQEQISESEVGRAIRTRRWKYAVTAPSRDPIRDSSSAEYVESYLYDLEADPYELSNLVDKQSHEEVRAHLRELLIGRMVTAGESAPLIHVLPVKTSGQLKVSKTEIYE